MDNATEKIGGLVWFIAYAISSILQYMAIIDFVIFEWNMHGVFAYLLATLLAGLPIIGTIAAILGSINQWGWSILFSLIAFTGPYILIFASPAIILIFAKLFSTIPSGENIRRDIFEIFKTIWGSLKIYIFLFCTFITFLYFDQIENRKITRPNSFEKIRRVELYCLGGEIAERSTNCKQFLRFAFQCYSSPDGCLDKQYFTAIEEARIDRVAIFQKMPSMFWDSSNPN